MKKALISIPDKMLNLCDSLVNIGYYPSRSALFCEAIREHLKKEHGFE